MSDQTTISFANLSLPQEGVAVVLAEEGPKLAPAAKELDKASKGLLSRAATISGFKGKEGHDRRSSRAGRTEIRAARADGNRQDRGLHGGGLAQSRRHRARAVDRQRGAQRAYRARWGREGHRSRGRRQLRARRFAPRLQVQKIQIDEDAEEERRRRERQDAQEDRHPHRRSAGGDQALSRHARHRQWRDARSRSRQRAGERARAGGVRPAHQGAHQGRRRR